MTWSREKPGMILPGWGRCRKFSQYKLKWLSLNINWSDYLCRCRKFMVEARKRAHQDLSNSTYPTHPTEQTSYLNFIIKILSPGHVSESIDNGYEITSLMVLKLNYLIRRGICSALQKLVWKMPPLLICSEESQRVPISKELFWTEISEDEDEIFQDWKKFKCTTYFTLEKTT